MLSKKLALALAVTAMAAAAHAGDLKGTAEVSGVDQHISAGGMSQDNNVHSASFMADAGRGIQAGASVTTRNAWGLHGSQLGLRAIAPVGQSFSVDGHLDLGDRDVIQTKTGYGATVRLAVREHSVGVGADRWGAQGFHTNVTRVEGAYKVPTMPLTLKADFAHTSDLWGSGTSAERTGVSATWGKEGAWTVSGRWDSGKLPVDMRSLDIDMGNKTERVGVSGKYWVSPSWGVGVGLTHEDHKDLFKATELRGSVFWKL